MPERQQTPQSIESKSTSQNQVLPKIQTPISNPMAIIQRAKTNPKSLTHADVMQLQHTIGNRAVGRLLSEIGLIPSKAKSVSPVQRQETPKDELLQGKMIGTTQRQISEEEEPLQTTSENDTGMTDNLKAGVENLSGMDMSNVRVYYNSDKPAKVGALAYTQGTDIHIAPGQEQHLPHEAWHVVQQAQGRVRPTMQLKGVVVNDDEVLEQEADLMGSKALQTDNNNPTFQFLDDRHEVQIEKSIKRVIKDNAQRVVQTKIQVGNKFYGKDSKNFSLINGDNGYLNRNIEEIVQLPTMLKARGTYVFTDWGEVKSYILGAIKDKGVIDDKTIELKEKLYMIGETHDSSSKQTILHGIHPSNFFYEGNVITAVGGDGTKKKDDEGKLDHQLLQAMFILSLVGDKYKKDEPLEGYASYVFNSLSEVEEVTTVKTEINNPNSTKKSILETIVKSYNLLKEKMRADSSERNDELHPGQKMEFTMQHEGMFRDPIDTSSNFERVGERVNDVRDYFFANQIKLNEKLPMIVLMGDDHIVGTLNNLLEWINIMDIEVYRNEQNEANNFASGVGKVIDGDSKDSDIYNDLPEDMKIPIKDTKTAAPIRPSPISVTNTPPDFIFPPYTAGKIPEPEQKPKSEEIEFGDFVTAPPSQK